MATGPEHIRRKLKRAAERLERVRRERDELIAEASEHGMSRREVGRAIGMTGAGVQHILKTRTRRSEKGAKSNGARPRSATQQQR